MARGFSFRNRSSSSSGPPLIFGIIWTAFSSIFVVIGLMGTLNEGKLQDWDEVPCMIERFEITASKKDDPPFRPDVLFYYEHGGGRHEGTKLWREKEGVDEYEDLSELREKLWSDLEVTCRVNPDDSGEAVLLVDQSSIWGGLAFALFGGGFVLVGVGLIVSSIKGKKAVKAKTAEKEDGFGGLLGCGFFGIFAMAGLGIFFGLVVPSGVTYFSMKSWVETPAEVIWSRVQSHSSDDGTTYSVDIFYNYRFDGREFRSNRWGLAGGSSSGRRSKEEVVRAHPRGKQITCYVDPDEPWRAVVMRDLGWSALFALFPLPFMAVGLGGLWCTFIRKPKKEAAAKSGKVSKLRVPMNEAKVGSKAVPKVGGKRRGRVFGFIALIFLAAFWNGITSVFVVIAWKSWQKGNPEWFLTIFLVPFVLIGAGLIGHGFYRFLAIFSPIYDVSWGDDDLMPGDRVRVSWRRVGGGGQPQRLTIWFLGQEEATYQRGSSTSTAKSVFHEAKLFETDKPQMMSAGTCDLMIPVDAVPSFSGAHNKLRWLVKLKAEVPWRPDVSDEHELEVGKGGAR